MRHYSLSYRVRMLAVLEYNKKKAAYSKQTVESGGVCDWVEDKLNMAHPGKSVCTGLPSGPPPFKWANKYWKHSCSSNSVTASQLEHLWHITKVNSRTTIGILLAVCWTVQLVMTPNSLRLKWTRRVSEREREREIHWVKLIKSFVLRLNY